MTITQLQQQAQDGDHFIFVPPSGPEIPCRWTEVANGSFLFLDKESEGGVANEPNAEVRIGLPPSADVSRA